MNARQGFERTVFDTIAAKQKVGKEDADKIALVVLISLDAAKRAQAPAHLADVLTRHLMMATVLWTRLPGCTHQYKVAIEGWDALVKACRRPTQLLDLTTREYQAIRQAINYYLRALPQLELGALVHASNVTEKTLREHDAKAAA